jgi:hypothetical protein
VVHNLCVVQDEFVLVVGKLGVVVSIPRHRQDRRISTTSMQLTHSDKHFHHISVFCRQLRCTDMQVHHNGAQLYDNGSRPLSSGGRQLRHGENI